MSCVEIVRVGIEHVEGTPRVSLPEYKTKGAAGMDVKAAIDEPVTIPPGGRVLIRTGFRMAIPTGYEIQIRSRSGLALNQGVIVINAPGTIDDDYRGPVGVVLLNTDHNPQTIKPGERIAQLVIQRRNVIVWDERPIEGVDNTLRGDGGFGSSGKE